MKGAVVGRVEIEHDKRTGIPFENHDLEARLRTLSREMHFTDS